MGTALSGLADAPTWLHELATGANRQAVRNLVELAITKRVSFVLISGSIVDHDEDLGPAANWLSEEFATLRSHHIRVVGVADGEVVRENLSRCCDVVLRSSESLAIHQSGGSLRLEVAQSSRVNADFVVDIGRLDVSGYNGLVYHADAKYQRSEDCERVSSDGWMSLSAGALQGVSVNDRGDHGCLLIEANVVARSIHASFAACDVLRYFSEDIHVGAGRYHDEILSGILDASHSCRHDQSRTVVLDLMIECDLEADLSAIGELSDQALTSALRERLHSGHQGVWIRQVRFSDASVVRPSMSPSPVFEEYLQASVGSDRLRSRSASEVVAGLSFLSRVA